jgi:lipopolysaccharide export system permease protein
MGFTLVALVSVLTGSFRRAGNLWRPVASVLLMVGLLAVGLTAQSLTARHPALVSLIWVQALLPGLVCAWILFMPGLLAGVAGRRRAPSPMRTA